MIKKIVIKNVASFDNEGVTLDDLKKVNFIYGGNACGKTTISRVLSCKDIQHSFPQCNVEWEGDPLHKFNTMIYAIIIKISVMTIFAKRTFQGFSHSVMLLSRRLKRLSE